MKKILLSCVTCLLALGLVTACDNEDEDVSGGGGDSTTQNTGTGSDTGTGSGGGTTEVTTLYNYTLELTLTDEDGNDPIPSYATAYIIGDWDNWGEFLPLKGGDKVYSYTFESISVGWHNFKAVMWYTDETVTWDDCIEIVTVPYEDEETGETKEGNAYFEVAASQGDDSKCQLEYTVTATLEPRVVSVTSITLDPTALSFAYEDIAESKTQTITASVIGSDGSVMADEEVSWASDTETVATVEEGVVTPVASGSATITAASVTDETVSATCSVYVGASGEVLVDSVVIDPNELTLTMDDAESGNTATVTATVSGADGATPTNPEVSWSQTGDVIEIGTPSQTDLVSEVTVTAVAAGSGTLTATAGGVTASIPVTVEPIEGDGTVTFTVYFVDNAAEIENYYSIPDYSDQEVEDTYKSVQGFFGYMYDGDDDSWVGPSDTASNDPMELIANGTTAEEGYSVTVSGLTEGTLKTYVYFAFTALLGDNTDIWNHDYGGSDVIITSTLASRGGNVEVYVEADPSSLIYPPSDDDFIDVVIGVKDTGSNSTADFSIDAWGSTNASKTSLATYSGTHSESIDKAVTIAKVNKSTDHLYFALFEGSETWGSGLTLASGQELSWAEDTYYLTVDASSGSGPTWSINFSDFASNGSTKLDGVSTFYIIYSFDFSAASTTPAILTSSSITFATDTVQ